MADGIKIGWKLENIQQMINQIEEIKAKVTADKVNISVNKDAVLNQLDSMLTGIKSIQKEASKPINLQINTIQSKQDLAGIKGSFEDIINTYKQLGQINVTPTFDSNGMLKDFAIQLQQVNGLIEKVKYSAKDFVDGKDSMTPLTFKVDNIKEINNLDKTIDKLENFKNKYNDAIKDLQNNGNIKDNSISEFQKQLDSLNITNFKEKVNEIKNTYSSLLNEQKQYTNELKQQEQLSNFVTAQKNKLNNTRSGYNGKLDIGSTQYLELEVTYGKLIEELNTYKKAGKALTTEEANDIKGRINNFGREKNSIIEVTNTIKQQENALDGLKNKFGNIIPTIKINQIKEALQSLYKSNDLKGDSNVISQEIEKLKQLANGVQRVKGFGSNVGTFSGTGINMGSSIQDIEQFIQKTVSAKASIDNIKESMDSLGNKVKTVNYSVNEGNGAISKHKMTIDSDTSSLYNLTTGLQNASSKNSSFSSSIGNAVKNLALYATGAGLAYEAINKIKDAIDNVNSVNKSQANLQMVTGMNQDQVKGLTKQYTDLANQLHVTQSQVLSSAENFLRAGHSVQESMGLIKATNIGAALSGQDAKDVADQLIAISNGFRMDTSNAKELNDVVSKLTVADNESATSFKEIATAMQGSSNMAQSVKVDFNHLLSYISTVSSVSRRNASSIGQSFAAQFARYQNVKGGQKFDADNQDLSNVERDLHKYADINLRSDSKTFKSYETVIDELTKKWGKLDEVSRAAISKAMAGTTHAEDFQVLMNNMDKVNGMMKDLGTASGYAEKQYEKVFAKSTQARINDFKNSVSNLYQSMISSESINKGLNALTGFIKTLDTLATTSKGSGVALAGLAASMVLIITKGKAITGLFTQIGIVLSNFMIVASKAGIVTGLADTFNILATSIKGVTLALLTNPLTYVAVGIGIATAAIIKHVEHQKELKEQTDSLRDSYVTLTQAMKDNDSASISSSSKNLQSSQEQLQNLIKQRNELQKQMNSSPNTGDPRVDAPIKNMNDNQLDDVNKKIKEQEQVLTDAGVAFNKTTGEVMALTVAESRIETNDVVDKIKDTTQAEIDHKAEIIKLGNEYNNLAQIQKPNIDQQQQMSDLAQTLSTDVSGLTTVKDKDGNITIKNSGLLNAEIGILGDEGVSVNKLKQIKLDAAKSNEQVQIGETTTTYEQAKARVQILNDEAKSWAGAANMSGLPDATKNMFKNWSKNSTQQANDIQGTINNIDNTYNKAMSDATSSTQALTDENNNGYTPSEDGATKATEGNTEAQKAQKAIIDEVKEKTKEYETELKNLDNIQNKLEVDLKHMDKTSEEYRQGLQQEIDLLKQKNGFLQKGVDLNNSSMGALGGYASGAGSQMGEEVAQLAEQYQGVPYVRGGADPSGFDCSGLVQYVYSQLGISLPRTSEEQFTVGTPVDKDNLQPGDLVFFEGSSPGHVAIYTGGGDIVAATHSGSDVKVESLDDVSNADGYSGARRIVSGGGSSTETSVPSSMTYKEIVDAAASKYGVDPNLIAAVIEQESTWDASQVTGSAVGLMQLEPDTAESMGLPRDQRTDPLKNVMAGTQYLAGLIDKYGEEKGVALYNTGENGGGNYGYANSVENKKSAYASGSKSIPDSSADVSNDTDVLSEMDDLNSKTADYQKQMIDNQSTILDLYTEKYNSQLDAFKAQIDNYTKLQDYNKQQYDLLRETDSASADKYAKAELTDENDIYGALSQKETFIRSQMTQTVFDKATLAQMKNDLLDTQEQEVETINKLHTDFTEWQDNALTDSTKQYTDQLTEIKAQLDLIDTEDKSNYQDELDLNKQELLQQEEIKARTEERLQTIKELIDTEKNDTTRQIEIDEYNKINNELLATNKEIVTINNSIDDLNLQNKLKPYVDDIKSVNDEMDVLNDKTDSSKANGETIEDFDKKLGYYNQINDDLQKQNDIYTQQIKLWQDLRSEFEQGSELWTEYNDKIDDAQEKQSELQKSQIDNAKKMEELAENQVLDIAENAIYGGETQQQFEDNAKARENAIDEQLKLMDKQEQNLEEQETRNKNLLDLEEARVKLQEDQANKSVQQLTKDKNGNWQFTYVANQDTVDQDEKDMRDKAQSNNDWERQTKQKHDQDSLNDEKDELEQEVSMRQEAMDRIKTNIENAFNDQKNLFKNGQTDISTIVENSLSQISNLYSSTFPEITNIITENVEAQIAEMNKLNPNFVNAQNNITGITNPQTPAITQHVVYGSGIDIDNAKQMFGTDGITYVNIDKDHMTDEQRKKIKLGDNDLLLGGAGVTYGITENQNGGTGTRLWGQDRYATNEKMANWSEENQETKHFVFAEGEDLISAKAIYGDAYTYIPTDRWTEKEWSELHTKAGDKVIGSQDRTPGLVLNGATRIYGQDRSDTANKIENNALDKGVIAKRNVYAGGKDYESAKQVLDSTYYNLIDISSKDFDASKVNLTGDDWVLGGEAVTSSLNNQISQSRARRIYGQTADDTKKALEKARDDDLANVQKYNQNVTKNIKQSTQKQTVLIQDAQTKESYSIEVGANTNLDTVIASMGNIYDVTNDGMGRVVVTVNDHVQEAIESFNKLLEAEAAAGIQVSSYTPTKIGDVDTRPVEYATGADAKILEVQYGETIRILPGTGFSRRPGSTRYDTNRLYQEDLARKGYLPIHDAGDLYKYADGGKIDYTGLAIVDGTPSKPEMVLNPDDTSKYLEASKLIRDVDLDKSLNAYQYIPDLMPNLMKSIPMDNLIKNNFRNQPTKVSNTFHFDKVELPNVVDGESFIKEMGNFGVKQYTSSYVNGY
ncbi:gamma-DL-glutamyl hydrolase precursor [Clostridium ragsdalei P11]|uniref:Gamma-DL-glutamyl hydrolase n=1 Tax=Clostridium ragsdalei P11 TaxID=1353534 RepID=A0A1A6AKX1_9CLOT|nr:phage tail tape measure protein [Clostridium ragsdalei]OBR90724.1 gamma-DL-glutamyl hydrolase precursor [Clostridium ragsdalei P11]